jgi:flagellar motor switch protein FliG
MTLRIEQIVGVKVKKLNYFQDIFENQLKKNYSKNQNKLDTSKNVNKTELNGIKDDEVSSIFKRINSLIENDKN